MRKRIKVPPVPIRGTLSGFVWRCPTCWGPIAQRSVCDDGEGDVVATIMCKQCGLQNVCSEEIGEQREEFAAAIEGAEEGWLLSNNVSCETIRKVTRWSR